MVFPTSGMAVRRAPWAIPSKTSITGRNYYFKVSKIVIRDYSKWRNCYSRKPTDIQQEQWKSVAFQPCGISTTPSVPHPFCSVLWRLCSRLVHQEYRALFHLRAVIYPNRSKPPMLLILPNYVLQRLNSWQIRAERLEVPFLHPAPTQRADDLCQVARITGAPKALAPVCS